MLNRIILFNNSSTVASMRLLKCCVMCIYNRKFLNYVKNIEQLKCLNSTFHGRPTMAAL